MRELEIVDNEARGLPIALGRGLNSVSKEGQLIAEAPTFGIENIPGEIPPFGFEFAVRVMVARKFAAPSGLGDFPVRT
jgi:hypothetical protein